MSDDKYTISTLDLEKLQSWQDDVDKRQELFQLNWDRWVKISNDKIAADRKSMQENRKVQIKHIAVVEGYLKALNGLVAAFVKKKSE